MVRGCVSEKLLDAVGLCCEVQTKTGEFQSFLKANNQDWALMQMHRIRCILLCFVTLAGWRATAQMCTIKKKVLCLIATALMFSLWNEHTRRVYPFCLKCEIKILNLFFSATINHLCKSSDRLHFCLCANNEYKWQFHPFDDSFQRFEGFSIYKREISHINACWHCSQRKTLYKDEVPEELWTSL